MRSRQVGKAWPAGVLDWALVARARSVERAFRADPSAPFATPFGPGLGWVEGDAAEAERDTEEALCALERFNERVMADADRWYTGGGEPAVKGLTEDLPRSTGRVLRFRCPVDGEIIEAPRVNGRATRSGKRAVVIVPALGTEAPRYLALQRLLALAGVSTVVVDLPGHGARAKAELEGPDALISANLGRTVHQFRKAVSAVVEAHRLLHAESIERVGILGVSAGACVGALASLFVSAATASPAVWRGCYTFATPDVANVVWSGEATADIRERLVPHLTRQRLERVWRVLSPVAHMRMFPERANRVGPILIVSAQHDTVTRPALTRELVAHLEGTGMPHRWDVLPHCGHYALAGAPFSWMWAAKVVSHFADRGPWRDA